MSRVLISRVTTVALLGGVTAIGPLPSAAVDYDVDCAVILCMAAGFPEEPSGTCSGAYDYMIDRITDRPPKPPFGTCTMSDGSAYDAAEVAFTRPPRQSRAGWICPKSAPMGFSETADYTFAAPPAIPMPNTSLQFSKARRATGSSVHRSPPSVSLTAFKSRSRKATAKPTFQQCSSPTQRRGSR